MLILYQAGLALSIPQTEKSPLNLLALIYVNNNEGEATAKRRNHEKTLPQP